MRHCRDHRGSLAITAAIGSVPSGAGAAGGRGADGAHATHPRCAKASVTTTVAVPVHAASRSGKRGADDDVGAAAAAAFADVAVIVRTSSTGAARLR